MQKMIADVKMRVFQHCEFPASWQSVRSQQEGGFAFLGVFQGKD